MNDLGRISSAIHRTSLLHPHSQWQTTAGLIFQHLDLRVPGYTRYRFSSLLRELISESFCATSTSRLSTKNQQDSALSCVRHKLLWQGYWLGLCRILYFRFGLCERRGVLRFFSLSLLLAIHRYRYCCTGRPSRLSGFP